MLILAQLTMTIVAGHPAGRPLTERDVGELTDYSSDSDLILTLTSSSDLFPRDLNAAERTAAQLARSRRNFSSQTWRSTKSRFQSQHQLRLLMRHLRSKGPKNYERIPTKSDRRREVSHLTCETKSDSYPRFSDLENPLLTHSGKWPFPETTIPIPTIRAPKVLHSSSLFMVRHSRFMIIHEWRT